MTLPIDYSPLWISLATTCVATLATFFPGILAAKLMYGARGRFRWFGLPLSSFLSPPVARETQHHRPRVGAVGHRDRFFMAGNGDRGDRRSFSAHVPNHSRAFEQINPNLLDASRTV
ncbi:MAG: hypothetical protein ABSE51_24115, partial [Terracidiphilus sp.]